MSLSLLNDNIYFRVCQELFCNDAAEKLGISIGTLKEYEKRGLIRPFHDPVNGRSQFFNEDLKWIRHIRSLIHSKGLNIASIQRLLAIIPCWEIQNCPRVKMKRCQALADKTSPCWITARKSCIEETNNCRDCKVYLEACKRAAR